MTENGNDSGSAQRQEQGPNPGLKSAAEGVMWNTPCTAPEAPNKSCNQKDKEPNLGAQAAAMMWPTPDASAANDGEDPQSFLARQERLKETAENGNGCGTPLAMAGVLWATPNATDLKGESQPPGRRPACDDDLPSQVTRLLGEEQDLWQTPHAMKGGGARRGGERGGEMLLPGQASLWATPNTFDSKDIEASPEARAASAERNRNAGQKNLREEVAGWEPGGLWATPDTGESLTGHGRRGGKAGNGFQSGAGLESQARELWPTATVSSGSQTAGDPTPGQTGGTTLPGAAEMLWATPSAQEPGIDPERLVDSEGKRPEGWNQRLYDRETGRLCQDGLEQQSAMWLTPCGMTGVDHSGKEGLGGEFAKQATMWQTPAAHAPTKEYTRDEGEKGRERLALAGQAQAMVQESEEASPQES
ncbi:MAG TPA: hypothetical protein VEJ18_07350, partial [Planctomycetota bacterium]|nr:hypothetical protein [Planctomycetota bacterium]